MKDKLSSVILDDLKVSKQLELCRYVLQTGTLQDIDYKVFFPTVEDNIHLVSKFETLVTKMFVQHIPGLQSLSAMANHHIEHQYSKNMALKSEVVCSYIQCAYC